MRISVTVHKLANIDCHFEGSDMRDIHHVLHFKNFS